MRRWTLGTRILLLVAGSVVGLALVVFATLAFVTGRQIDRAVRKDVVDTGNVQAASMAERTATLTDQCRLMARQPAFRYMYGNSDRRTVDDFARDVAGQIHADAISITDGNGKLLGATTVDAHAAAAGVEMATQGGEFSGIATIAGVPMLSVSVPALDPASHAVLMTLTASNAIDSRMADSLKRQIGSEVAFVDHGRVVGASLHLPVTIPTPRDAPTIVVVDGRRYFALYAPLPNTDAGQQLGYVVLRPYEAAMAGYLRLRTVLGFLAVGALALGLAAGALVARSITRPLDGVVRFARTVQSGEWPDPIEVRRTDEIGILQSAFNEMTAAVRESQDRLMALIDTDLLTGLDNHRRFQERLLQETKRCQATAERLCLLIFDIDQFHDFNQQYGHGVGDETLAAAGKLARELLPEVAIAARYGGGEIAALIPTVSLDVGERLAETIRAAFAERAFGESGARLTLSIGCADFSGQVTDAESLTLAAELAVSLAKQLGRNRVCRFENVPGNDPAQMSRFLHDGSYATIQALAAAVDAKDTYTQGHSERVAKYATMLAEHAGLSKADVQLIYTTGTLHDVGKIGVPDSILKKQAPLDAEERAIMETHPVLGEVIVRKVPQLAATLPGVRHHHERWDGKGYPDRLAGEAIPLIARVLAVADTFDAMTSDRPYRKGMSWEVALAEIAKNAGTQFDPRFANAFVEMWEAEPELKRAA